MRLRNAKDTVKLSLYETLNDVHPLALDDPFHFLVERGLSVWVRVPNVGWRRGTVLHQEETLFEKDNIVYQWAVEYGSKKRKTEIFQPIHGNMKPDTPEVHELLRRNGVIM